MSGEPSSRILVVDDEAGMRWAIQRVLMPPHDVETAASVAEAIEVVGRERFDMALIDIRLPDGNGYQLNQEVRRISPTTDVILMSGSLSQPDEKLYLSLDGNAFYFLFKPFDRRVLKALVERCLRLRRAQQDNESHLARLSEDLEEARRFQHSLLGRRPLRHSGWVIEGRFQSCDEIGGDTYDMLPIGESTVFYLSDVVGHGVRAAMFAGMLRAAMSAAWRVDPDPERVIAHLREGADFFQPPHYATLIYGQLGADGELRYVNGGHPPALLLSGGEVERLESTGPLLMCLDVDMPPFRVEQCRLQPGDRLLLYSDGLTEAKNTAEEELGLEAVAERLRRGAGQPGHALLDSLLELAQEHRQGRPPDDDVSLLLVERT